nr:zinc ribbon domain-containing protein [Sphingomonas sp.]
MDDGAILIVGFLAVACAFGSALAASHKGRSMFSWGAIGFFIGPFGLLASIVAPPTAAELDRRQEVAGTKRKCPYCAEIVQAAAIKCRFCGSDIPSENLKGNPESSEAPLARTEVEMLPVPVNIVLVGVLVFIVYLLTR